MRFPDLLLKFINVINSPVDMKSLLFGLTPALVAANCRVSPKDAQWPTECSWGALNGSVHGQLIRTVPAGHVCHDPTYNEELCNELKKNWYEPFFKSNLVEAIMTPSFANNSCDPLGPREDPCEIGRYAQYSINVTSPADVAAGLAFVQKHNIRVVVKNTGHEYVKSFFIYIYIYIFLSSFLLTFLGRALTMAASLDDQSRMAAFHSGHTT